MGAVNGFGGGTQLAVTAQTGKQPSMLNRAQQLQQMIHTGEGGMLVINVHGFENVLNQALRLLHGNPPPFIAEHGIHQAAFEETFNAYKFCLGEQQFVQEPVQQNLLNVAGNVAQKKGVAPKVVAAAAKKANFNAAVVDAWLSTTMASISSMQNAVQQVAKAGREQVAALDKAVDRTQAQTAKQSGLAAFKAGLARQQNR